MSHSLPRQRRPFTVAAAALLLGAWALAAGGPLTMAATPVPASMPVISQAATDDGSGRSLAIVVFGLGSLFFVGALWFAVVRRRRRGGDLALASAPADASSTGHDQAPGDRLVDAIERGRLDSALERSRRSTPGRSALAEDEPDEKGPAWVQRLDEHVVALPSTPPGRFPERGRRADHDAAGSA